MERQNKFKNWLENIKSKDEQDKQNFAFWVSLVITFFIALVWGFGFFYEAEDKIKNSMEQTASPINVLKDQAIQLFNSK